MADRSTRRTSVALRLLPWVIAALLVGCGTAGPTPTPRPACPTDPPTLAESSTALRGADRAVVVTNKGSFTIELYGDQAPLATTNFVNLARCGFYDGIRFHRVIAFPEPFVAQAGDPHTDADRAGSDPTLIGSGGPGYRFEIEPPPDELQYVQYSVSMANSAQPFSNGSQFFIALADLNGRLERTYTIFGQVTEGTDVVDAIGTVPVEDPATGFPTDPVIIERIEISADPVPTPS